MRCRTEKKWRKFYSWTETWGQSINKWIKKVWKIVYAFLKSAHIVLVQLNEQLQSCTLLNHNWRKISRQFQWVPTCFLTLCRLRGSYENSNSLVLIWMNIAAFVFLKLSTSLLQQFYENWNLKFSSTPYFCISKASGLSTAVLLQSMFFPLYQQNQVVILKLIYVIFLCTIQWDPSCHPHFTVWHLVKAIMLQAFWNQFLESTDWSIY